MNSYPFHEYAGKRPVALYREPEDGLVLDIIANPSKDLPKRIVINGYEYLPTNQLAEEYSKLSL
jgi:hypothetical protein